MNPNRSRKSFRLLLCFLLPSGCIAAQALVANPTDYHTYRQFRFASSDEERLRFAHLYLKSANSSSFAGEIATWYQVNEDKWFNEASHNFSMANRYLLAIPDGARADQIRTFRDTFERERIEGPKRAERERQLAKIEAEKARRQTLKQLEDLLGRAVIALAYTHEKANENLVLFKKKVGTLTFSHPTTKNYQHDQRSWSLELQVLQTDHSHQIIFTSQDWFAQWLETMDDKPSDPLSPQRREESLFFAKNRLEHISKRALANAIPTPPCQVVEKATARHIECASLKASAMLNQGAQQIVIEGRFVLQPIPSSSSSGQTLPSNVPSVIPSVIPSIKPSITSDDVE